MFLLKYLLFFSDLTDTELSFPFPFSLTLQIVVLLNSSNACLTSPYDVCTSPWPRPALSLNLWMTVCNSLALETLSHTPPIKKCRLITWRHAFELLQGACEQLIVLTDECRLLTDRQQRLKQWGLSAMKTRNMFRTLVIRSARQCCARSTPPPPPLSSSSKSFA